MKHSNSIGSRDISQNQFLAGLLLWLLPTVMLVPSVVLSVTEYSYTQADSFANILLPAGLYLLLAGCRKKIGTSALLFIPVMILCAFQIVILYLYGESIIAVDMFLNVLTTNTSEVMELLGNLLPAIATVCVLYIPVIVMAVVCAYHRLYTSGKQRSAALICGAVLLAAGTIAAMIAFTEKDGYSPVRKVFPVNVVSNIFTAAERTAASNNYSEASESFRFDAVSLRRDNSEIYVLVIGETSRSGDWQINGYERPTNPRLSARSGLTFFRSALTESNTTHKSVPLLMTHIDCSAFGDSIYCIKSIMSAFNEAGFTTAWISNQKRNNSLIDFFGEQAEKVVYINDDGGRHYDADVIPHISSVLADAGRQPLFIAVHTYGSHFNYRDRYPDDMRTFTPDDATSAELSNRPQLVNAYDNTIRYTDMVLDSIIGTIEKTGRPAALLYLADHGEDIFDDSRERFLHASPTPTYYQLHVPMLIWTSAEFMQKYPDKVSALQAHSTAEVASNRSTFHTLIDLAGIATPYFNKEASLASAYYRQPERRYLNDYNEAVPLMDSGLRELDFEQLQRRSILFGQSHNENFSFTSNCCELSITK